MQATERVIPDATPPTRSPRSARWFAGLLLAVALLALAVRLVYTFTVADDIVLTGDAQTYHLLAARLADGDGYVRTQGELAGTPPPNSRRSSPPPSP